MKCLVTGGAGFVANSLIRALLLRGDTVIAVDNLKLGSRENLSAFSDNLNFSFQLRDLSDTNSVKELFEELTRSGGIDEIWHLAANSDIPSGQASPDVDLRDTFLTTYELLRSARTHGFKKFFFASSSAIYGDLGDKKISESTGPLLPISNYGAMKLASEGQISAAAEAFLDKAVLFRFPNVVGVPATHGVILDFAKKLVESPFRLDVLGDGTQKKAYLHVSDLVSAMLFIADVDDSKLAVYNIGPIDEGVTVQWIAEQVVVQMKSSASIVYGTGGKGWVGDVPKFHYKTKKLQDLGWTPLLSSSAAVHRAIREIVASLK